MSIVRLTCLIVDGTKERSIPADMTKEQYEAALVVKQQESFDRVFIPNSPKRIVVEKMELVEED